jgi:hypothetical protein
MNTIACFLLEYVFEVKAASNSVFVKEERIEDNNTKNGGIKV